MIAATLKTWKNVLTKPGEQTLAAESNKPSATLLPALTWLVLAGAGVLLLKNLETTETDQWVLPPEVRVAHTPSSLPPLARRFRF